jgi:hypothetical protein
MEGNFDSLKTPTNLTLQEKVLATGMLYTTNATTEYGSGEDGTRIHSHKFNKPEWKALTREFQENPQNKLAYARNNLLAIMKDKNLPIEERQERVKRYTDAYLALSLKLDHQAFPPNARVHMGIPEYIPDGLSDMGSDSTTTPSTRSREKIRIDKAEIFERAKPLFYKIFSTEMDSAVTSEQWKKSVVAKVAQFVYESMPYNHSRSEHPMASFRSVNLAEITDQRLSVCRHHALMVQVLLQEFGITSRLMKTDVVFDNKKPGKHVNNAVRIEKKWYLLDATNPIKNSQENQRLFIAPLPETSLDLNSQVYAWRFDETNGRTRTYTSRANMYWRIMDNVKNPTR